MRLTLALIGCFAWLGCFKAPEIVVVDRATALEEQAAGSFDELERKLARAGIAPRPVPFTPEELEALGIHEADLVNNTEMTDADRLDRSLVQRCVGESNDGLLIETPSACRGAMDAETTRRLIERTNAARGQLWRWMQEQRPGTNPEDIRRSWQLAHARGLVCGGWMQLPQGSWEAKKC
jgi:Protein of unknown function (DUF1318)